MSRRSHALRVKAEHIIAARKALMDPLTPSGEVAPLVLNLSNKDFEKYVMGYVVRKMFA